MTTIGTFKRNGQGYEGKLITLTAATKLRFTPAEKASDTQPDYRVFAGTIELGAAWTKLTADGIEYLSVRLDDPSFPRPINAALFHREGQTFDLVWSRQARQ
jgi:uncharacterized protein (DUF736 family)